MALDQTTRAILAGAPELVHTPTATVDLATAVQGDPTGTLDPQGAAASLAMAQGAAGMQAGAEDVSAPTHIAAPTQPKPSHHSLLGSIVGGIEGDVIHPVTHALGSAVGEAANVLQKPLAEVQHLYRYQHDVLTRHGVMAFLGSLAVAPVSAPMNVAHDWLGSPESGPYAKSWDITRNGEQYRDTYGHAVNPGFDLANIVDHVINGHDYIPQGYHVGPDGKLWTRDEQSGIDVPTGIVNAVFDLALDPTLRAGKIAKLIKAEGVAVGGRAVTLAADPTERARQLENLTADGTHINFTDDPNRVVVGKRVLYQGRAVRTLVDPDGNRASNIYDIYRNNGGVHDAFNRLANLDTEDIVRQYPMLRPLAAELGNAATGPEVAQVFHDALTVRNYSFVSNGLPSTGITRRGLAALGKDTQTFQGAASDAIDKMPHLAQMAFNYKPFTLDSRTLQISGKEFDPDDPASINGIRNVILYSQNRRVANNAIARYLEAPDLGERINIITTGFRDALRAAGVPDEHDLLLRWNKDIEFLAKNRLRPIYGMDEDGNAVRILDPETGEPTSLGLFNNQTGKLAFPDFNEMRKAVLSERSGWSPRKVGFQVDDWLYHHYTGRIFKNLILLSVGFGLRVAAGELVPATLQNNARRVAGSGLAAVAAKLNPTLHDLATEHADGLVGAAAKTRRGIGVVKSIDPETKRVTVAYGNEEATHGAGSVTLLHRPVADDELMATARNLGMSITGDEVPHYKAAVAKALWGVGKALVDDDYRKQALFNVMSLDGHLVAPGLMSNHDVLESGAGRTEDLREYMRQSGARVPDKPQRMKDNFVRYDANNDNHPMFWHFAIKEASKDPGVQKGAQAYLRAVRRGADKDAATRAFVKADTAWMSSDSDVAAQFRYKMAGHGQGPETYSQQRARAVRGLLYGQNGELNRDVLEGLAGQADVPNVADLAQRDQALRPVAVKGRELEDVPDIGGFERLTRWGWRRALHPIINGLSRAPLYTLKTTEEYKFLKPWVDNGLLSENEARGIAQVRGAQNMLPLIHNTKLRSQMSELFRNVAPFYFAQEQAYKRYGRVVLRDPVAFEKMVLAYHGLYGSGIIRQDESGQNHIVFPGAGEFSKWMTTGAQAFGLPVMGGLPSMMSGDTISLKSVIPEGNLPSASPLVAVPLKAIQAMFPDTEPLINQAIGPVAEQESMWDELIPNQTLKRVLQSVGPLDGETAFTTSYMHSIAWAAHQAQTLRDKADALPASDPRKAQLLAQADRLLPGPNADFKVRQHALDRLKNSTRILTMVKALVGAVSPLSPSIDVGDVQLRNELRDDIKAHGLANGVQVFTAKHPDATADTVFLSDSTQTGTALPATAQALKWVDENRAWTQDHALATAYLIPQAPGKFSQEAYNQELALGLRQRKSPDDLVRAIYAAATNSTFFADLKRYDAAKTEYANDPPRLRELRQSWGDYTQQLSNANPVWYADLNDSNKQMVAQQAFYQVKQALADKNTPYSPQTELIAGLIQDYDNYTSAVSAAKQGLTNVSVSQLQDSWKQYLDDEAQKVPQAAAFIHGVLRRLP